jgi:ribosomal protein S18 acetylase RimI-like enzyme
LDANARRAETQLDAPVKMKTFSMLIIRLATLYDIPTLMSLVRRVVPLMQAAGNFQWNDTYPNAEILLRDVEQRQLWVADISISESEDASIIGGFAAITTDQPPEYTQVGWDINDKAIVIHRLAVDPDLRGLGIATALMEEAEALAYESEISILRVDTNVMNQATQKLFPKLGYKLAGEMALAIRPGQRFLCYEKRLAEV